MTEAVEPSRQCGVCHLRRSRYICPRCNAQYCSLDCYKQHSDQCTEGFYRDSATSELKSITATEADKWQMLEILQKLHDQQLEEEDVRSDGGSSSGEEEDGGGLSQPTVQRLMKKLEAGADITAADLSPGELQEFHRAVAAGAVSEVVQLWQPWWLSQEAAQLELGEGGTRLVAPVSEAQVDEGLPSLSVASSALPPPPSKPLPPLAALTKARPSPLLQYHLLDLLYAYCYVLRLYNGDYRTDPAEAADLLFSLSAVLAATAAGQASPAGGMAETGPTSGPSPASVLLDCISRACSPLAGGRQQQGAAIAVLSDVAAILQLGRPVVVTALMDLSCLLEAARQALEGGPAWQGGAGAPSKDVERLQHKLVAAERKLLFFLAWANEQPQEVCGLLALAVSAELEKHLAALQGSGSSGAVDVARGLGLGQQPQPAQQQARTRAPAGALVQEL